MITNLFQDVLEYVCLVLLNYKIDNKHTFLVVIDLMYLYWLGCAIRAFNLSSVSLADVDCVFDCIVLCLCRLCWTVFICCVFWCICGRQWLDCAVSAIEKHNFLYTYYCNLFVHTMFLCCTYMQPRLWAFIYEYRHITIVSILFHSRNSTRRYNFVLGGS